MCIKIIYLLLYMTLIGCQNGQNGDHTDIAKLVDCMPGRKNMKTIKQIDGNIIIIADSYLIETSQGNERYAVCNLPAEFKKVGIVVRFSLIIKEIYPTEKLMATPAVLIKIEKLK